ncbi:hypothetical protein KY290_001950 [Solanum tuberosum]|uniref:Uncharacterized protein n=2 Tax=Solanum tuberosum TaxID=4113 RepID=A0ABQ7WNM8_SOLTU|nr:hypothetical protein KY284_004591 [Solanum tuberosum]KAH0730911.1 hypothetical protein KY289_002099 [Solanum tuberosum]KAH0765949.1 hypothetical protein KY285_001820 [Solanum tuberosum]KAH0782352.1 hypothetical protein KY290_001950 [Solanum tuberosum]
MLSRYGHWLDSTWLACVLARLVLKEGKVWVSYRQNSAQPMLGSSSAWPKLDLPQLSLLKQFS